MLLLGVGLVFVGVVFVVVGTGLVVVCAGAVVPPVGGSVTVFVLPPQPAMTNKERTEPVRNAFFALKSPRTRLFT